MTAMSAFAPADPPSSAGSAKRYRPAASARRTISPKRSSQARAGTPPAAVSVRANSRRWSKNWGFSASSGATSRAMNASISASRVSVVAVIA